MTVQLGRAHTLLASLLLAALVAMPAARGLDRLWIGTDGSNWDTDTNWPESVVTPGFFPGEPLADFDEQAVINNNTTAIVNTSHITAGTSTGGIRLGVT